MWYLSGNRHITCQSNIKNIFHYCLWSHLLPLTTLNRYSNKKVLLRECKRHTARCVVSTPSVVLPGYPPGGVPSQVPPRGGSGTPLGGYPVRYPGGYQVRYPPGGYPVRYPPGGVPGQVPPPTAPWHSGKCCKALWDMGTPPCGQTDGWMEGQTRVKTLPSRRTTYAGGNEKFYRDSNGNFFFSSAWRNISVARHGLSPVTILLLDFAKIH